MISNQNLEANNNDKSFFVIGIGASAGGLEALETFFNHLYDFNEGAIIIVQHLSPDFKSLMVEILSKHTSMKVVQVEDGMEIQKGYVYLIPPKKLLILDDYKLYLTEREVEHGPEFTIDKFFYSLANAMHEKAIAIILSGTGSDGSRGIKVVKQLGGTVIVQSEDSARFDGMPRNAILSGAVDYVLPPEKMPEIIRQCIQNRKVNSLQQCLVASEGDIDKLPPEFSELIAMVQQISKIDYKHYKPGTLYRQIIRRMQNLNIDTFQKYLHFIETTPSELTLLSRNLLIGVTSFFRDKEAFEVIENQVIPQIFASKKADEVIRVWVAGCSTGEEAYSLAVLFREYQEKINQFREIKIIATDIDAFAIDFAGNGLYPMPSSNVISPERIKKYFIIRGQNVQVVAKIRQMVLFAKHNLLTDPPFTKIDLISCRNVLIYMQPEWQDIIEAKFTTSLLPGGYLFLGASETLGKFQDFYTPIDRKWKIYQYKGGAKITASSYLPSLKKNEGTIEYSKGTIPHYYNYTLKKPNLSSVLESLKDRLLEDFAPTCAVLEENLNLFYLGGAPSPYFQLPRGKTSFHIKDVTKPPLSSLIAVAAPKVFREKTPLSYKQVNLALEENSDNNDSKNNDSNGSEEVYDISFFPYCDDRNHVSYVIVTLKPALIANSSEKQEKIETISFNKTVDLHLLELEEELNTTKAILQNTIEELEAANEELQTTNEELMSSNEELQSSNEELQSVNEELITLNSEYQAKNRELTIISNDIENIFRSTDIGTIFLDSNLLIRKFNQAASTYFNLLEVDIARPIAHISQKFTYPSLIQDLSEVMYSLIPKKVEILTDNGKWIQIRIFPYLNEEQTCQGVILQIIDITEHRTLLLEVARKEANYRKVISFLPFLTLKINALGDILEIITAPHRETFQPIAELLSSQNSLVSILANLCPKEASQLADALKQTIAKSILTENNEYLEFCICQNQNYWLRLNITALLPEKQEFLAVFEDISYLYNRLQEDQKAKIQAESESHSKSELIASINHSIRNPLNGMVGLLALLQKTELNEIQRKYIELMQIPIDILQKVVRNLLDLSRLQSSGDGIGREEFVNIDSILQSLLEYNTPSAQEKGIQFWYNPHVLPPIYANPIKINQLLVNFLELFVTLASDAYLNIELKLLPQNELPLYLQFCFSTNAVDTRMVFEQLISSSVDKTVFPKKEGLEMVFWIVREVLHLLHCELRFETSTEKEYQMVLTLSLPVAPPKSSSSEDESPREGKAQILIVDDEPLNREILRDLLELEGWSCDLAQNGLEALEKCKKYRYQVVFMDIRMPVMDGIESISKIRAFEEGKGYQTPIIILTAYGLPGDKDKYLQSGANEYLTKPVDAKTLLDTIQKYLVPISS
ncbi:MAG: response regulator [Bacteroidia bacterium]|nr:response regulator [Bacteroidia bacterium]